MLDGLAALQGFGCTLFVLPSGSRNAFAHLGSSAGPDGRVRQGAADGRTKKGAPDDEARGQVEGC